MRCCPPSTSPQSGTAKFFSKRAKQYLKKFRKKGLAKEQQRLAEGIGRLSLEGKSILEVGCGVGSLHLTLLQAGASRATGIDISEGMIDKAKALSQELSLSERTTYYVGDFVETPVNLGSADIVILDKVLCCYEDVESLLDKSISKAAAIYALSFPKPGFFIKYMIWIPIAAAKIFRWSFHPYWHDWDAIVAKIERSGFRQTYQNATIVWSILVFERSRTASAIPTNFTE